MMNSRGWHPRIGVNYHAALKGPNKTEGRGTLLLNLESAVDRGAIAQLIGRLRLYKSLNSPTG